jgi:oxygen-dependent protoporphyrinogen oxidase
MLINLWYPVPHANFPHNGFGYLIPQATPFSQNPECLLGVIFDSDREFPLPTPSTPNPPNRGADTLHGTKLTVMMGGHYWSSLPRSSLPTAEEAIAQAKAAVARHLQLPADLSAAAHASAKLCENCIPQHVVGHGVRMRAAHSELECGFKGRLAVAGQSYQNPGVLGMLRAGRDVAMQIAGRQVIRRRDGGEGAEVAPWTVGETGLERFSRQPVFQAVEKTVLPLRFGSGAFVDGTGMIVPRGGGRSETGDQGEGR